MKNNISGQAGILICQSPGKVWEALTTPEIIKQYFFGTNTITNWRIGSPIKFQGEWQGKQYEDKGTILKFEKNKILSYEYWSSMSGIEDKPENYMIVTYELLEDSNNNTTLTITQENIPDEQTKEHSVKNWQNVLDKLKS